MISNNSNQPLGNGATPLFADPFTGSSTLENKWIVTTGSGSKSPGLTAGTATAPAGGIAGFNGAAGTDTAGNGVLRLTDNTAATLDTGGTPVGGQAGAVIYNQNLFAKSGVSIEFEYYQYGGTEINGAKGDGLSFFLIDGATATPTVGAFGGSLGYAQRNVAGETATAGAAGGYLGIGFDSFGNFATNTEGRVGGSATASPDSVTIRGSATTDYKFLTTSGTINGGIDNADPAATRANSGRKVQITLEGDGKLSVKFDFNKDGDFDDAGETVIDKYETITAGGNSVLPDTLKFGFAASTGLASNFHELSALKISSVTDVLTGGGSINYTANTAAVAIAPALAISPTVVPTPSSTFNGATVGITPATYKTGQDFLTVGAFTGSGTPPASGTFANSPLTWAFNSGTGVLTISGAGTTAQYQSALDQVTYYNNAGATATPGDRVAKYTLTGIPGAPSLDSIIKVGAGNPAVGRPEILFQNSQTGQVAIWAVDTKGVLTGAKYVTLGSAFGTAAGSRLSVPQGWRVVDTGDVDKDGIADILWYDPTSRKTAIHYMTNEGQIKAAGFLKTGSGDIQVPGAEGWSPVGLADVNGDTNLDIVWRSTGLDVIAYWTVAGTNTTLTGGGFIKNAAGTADFKVGDTSTAVKLGDFDGDGKVDVLFKNGKVALLGGAVGANAVAKTLLTLPSNGDTSLVVKAVGDYNGDGTTDLAWESTTSDKQVLEYLKVVNGSFDPAGANFKSLATTGSFATWNIGASKDFNADTTPDLVWHNSINGGETAIWAIDKTTGGFVLGGATAFVTFNGQNIKTEAGWDVVGADDFGSVTLV